MPSMIAFDSRTCYQFRLVGGAIWEISVHGGAIAMEYDRGIRRLPCRIGIAMTAVCVLESILVWPSLPADADQSSETLDRPKIGLVLAGGGAMGIAHVGVI